MHTLLDLYRNTPTLIRVTSRDVHDVNLPDEILREAGAFFVIDRGYTDFQRLFVFTLRSAFFVVGAKSKPLLQRHYSHPENKSADVCSDHTCIRFAINSTKAYPDKLRCVSHFDVKTRKRFKFFTNNFALPAINITWKYKSRRQVEIFLKWVKQHLRNKKFLWRQRKCCGDANMDRGVCLCNGRHRPQAVGLEASLYQILQILSLTLFEKTPILCALQAIDPDANFAENVNQLILFNF